MNYSEDALQREDITPNAIHVFNNSFRILSKHTLPNKYFWDHLTKHQFHFLKPPSRFMGVYSEAFLNCFSGGESKGIKIVVIPMMT